MATIATLGFRVDTSGLAAGQRALQDLGTAGERASESGGLIDRRMREASGGVSTLGGAMRGLGGIVAGLGLATLAREAIDVADSYKSMEAGLRIVTNSTAEFEAAQRAVRDIAKETRSPLEDVAGLYRSLAPALGELGQSQEDVALAVELVNKAMATGGGSAEAQAAGIRQFSQAMASGVLRGDEFNSIMENTPGLTKALADGLGVPIGALREMASEGELTAEKVIAALKSQEGAINASFKEIPVTSGQAWTLVRNAVFDAIGAIDARLGDASGAWATLLVGVASGIEQGGKLALGAIDAVAIEWARFKAALTQVDGEGPTILTKIGDAIRRIGEFLSPVVPYLDDFAIAAAAITGAGLAAAATALAAMAAVSFGPVVLAIGGIAAAAVTLRANWDGISAWWTGLWDGLDGDVVQFAGRLATSIGGLAADFGRQALALATGFATDLSAGIGRALDGVQWPSAADLARSAAGLIVSFAEVAVSMTNALVLGISARTKTLGSDIEWPTAAAIVSGAATLVTAFSDTARAMAATFTATLGPGIRDAFSSVEWPAAREVVSAAADLVAGFGQVALASTAALGATLGTGVRAAFTSIDWPSPAEIISAAATIVGAFGDVALAAGRVLEGALGPGIREALAGVNWPTSGNVLSAAAELVAGFGELAQTAARVLSTSLGPAVRAAFDSIDWPNAAGVISSAAETVRGFADVARTSIAALGNSLGAGIASVLNGLDWPTVGAVLSSAASLVGAFGTLALTASGALTNGLFNLLRGFVSEIEWPSAAQVQSSAAELIGGFGTVAITAGAALVNGLSQLLSGFGSAITWPSPTQVVSGAADLIAAFGTLAGSMIGKLTDDLASGMSTLAQDIQWPTLGQIAAGAADLILGFGELALLMVGGLVRSLSNAVSSFVSEVEWPSPEAIGTGAAALVTGFVELAVTLTDKLITGLGEKMRTGLSQVDWPTLGQVVSGAGNLLKAFADTAGVIVATFIFELGKGIVGLISEPFERALSFIPGIGDEYAREAGAQIPETLATTISANAGVVSEASDRMMQGVPESAIRARDDFQRAGEQIPLVLASAINDGSPSVRAATGELVEEAERGWLGRLKDFVGLGEEIPRGAAEGVRYGTLDFSTAVLAMSDAGRTEFVTANQIQSPSRVYFTFGEFIARGAADGVASGSADFVAAVGDMAQAGVGAMQTFEDGSAIVSDYGDSLADVIAVTLLSADVTRDAKGELSQWGDEQVRIAGILKVYEERQRFANIAVTEGATAAGVAKLESEGWTRAQAEAGVEAQRLAESMEYQVTAFENLGREIASGIIDADSIGGALKSIGDSLKSWLADIAQHFLQNAIVAVITGDSTGLAGTIQSALSMIGSFGDIAGNVISSIGGLFGGAGSAAADAAPVIARLGGAATATGAAAGQATGALGGLSSAVGTVTTSAAGTAAAMAAGVAAAGALTYKVIDLSKGYSEQSGNAAKAGAAIGLLTGGLAGMVTKSAIAGGLVAAIFGGDWKSRESGVRAATNGVVEFYETFRKSGGLFSGADYKTEMENASAAITKAINSTFGAMRTTLEGQLESFGQGTSAGMMRVFNRATIQFSNDEELASELSRVMADQQRFAYSRMGDELQEIMAGFVDIATASNEEINAAFEEVGTILSTVGPMFELAGIEFAGSLEDQAAAILRFTEELGGLEVAMDSMQAYLELTTTAFERQGMVLDAAQADIDAFNERFGLVGDQAITTGEQLQRFVETNIAAGGAFDTAAVAGIELASSLAVVEQAERDRAAAMEEQRAGMQAVTDASVQLGFSFTQVAVPALLEAAGGAEEFATRTGAFFTNFYTQAEQDSIKLDVARQRVAEFNIEAGLTGDAALTSGEALRAHVEQMNATGDVAGFLAATNLDLQSAMVLVDAAAQQSADNFSAVSEAIGTAGLQFDIFHPAARESANALIEMSGGLDAFNASNQSYYDAFYSAKEKEQAALADAAAQVLVFNESLGLAGAAAIDTEAEVRQYIDGLDLSTEAGRQARIEALEYVDALRLIADTTGNAELGLGSLDAIIASLPESMQEPFKAMVENARGSALDTSTAVVDGLGTMPEAVAALAQQTTAEFAYGLESLAVQARVIGDSTSLEFSSSLSNLATVAREGGIGAVAGLSDELLAMAVQARSAGGSANTALAEGLEAMAANAGTAGQRVATELGVPLDSLGSTSVAAGQSVRGVGDEIGSVDAISRDARVNVNNFALSMDGVASSSQPAIDGMVALFGVVRELTTSSTAANGPVFALRGTIDALAAATTAANGPAFALDASIDGLAGAATAANGPVFALDASIDGLTGSATAANGPVFALDSSLDGLTGAATAANGPVFALDNSIRGLTGSATSANGPVFALDSSIDGLSGAATSANGPVFALDRSIDGLISSASSASGSVGSLADAANDLGRASTAAANSARAAASRIQTAFDNIKVKVPEVTAKVKVETYSDVDGSHAAGLDYVPFDGYRAELHKGESVLTAAQTSMMNTLIGSISALDGSEWPGRVSGSDATSNAVPAVRSAPVRAVGSGMVAELRALREEVAGLRRDRADDARRADAQRARIAAGTEAGIDATRDVELATERGARRMASAVA